MSHGAGLGMYERSRRGSSARFTKTVILSQGACREILSRLPVSAMQYWNRDSWER